MESKVEDSGVRHPIIGNLGSEKWYYPLTNDEPDDQNAVVSLRDLFFPHEEDARATEVYTEISPGRPGYLSPINEHLTAPTITNIETLVGDDSAKFSGLKKSLLHLYLLKYVTGNNQYQDLANIGCILDKSTNEVRFCIKEESTRTSKIPKAGEEYRDSLQATQRLGLSESTSHVNGIERMWKQDQDPPKQNLGEDRAKALYPLFGEDHSFYMWKKYDYLIRAIDRLLPTDRVADFSVDDVVGEEKSEFVKEPSSLFTAPTDPLEMIPELPDSEDPVVQQFEKILQVLSPTSRRELEEVSHRKEERLFQRRPSAVTTPKPVRGSGVKIVDAYLSPSPKPDKVVHSVSPVKGEHGGLVVITENSPLKVKAKDVERETKDNEQQEVEILAISSPKMRSEATMLNLTSRLALGQLVGLKRAAMFAGTRGSPLKVREQIDGLPLAAETRVAPRRRMTWAFNDQGLSASFLTPRMAGRTGRDFKNKMNDIYSLLRSGDIDITAFKRLIFMETERHQVENLTDDASPRDAIDETQFFQYLMEDKMKGVCLSFLSCHHGLKRIEKIDPYSLTGAPEDLVFEELNRYSIQEQMALSGIDTENYRSNKVTITGSRGQTREISQSRNKYSQARHEIIRTIIEDRKGQVRELKNKIAAAYKCVMDDENLTEILSREEINKYNDYCISSPFFLSCQITDDVSRSSQLSQDVFPKLAKICALFRLANDLQEELIIEMIAGKKFLDDVTTNLQLSGKHHTSIIRVNQDNFFESVYKVEAVNQRKKAFNAGDISKIESVVADGAAKEVTSKVDKCWDAFKGCMSSCGSSLSSLFKCSPKSTAAIPPKELGHTHGASAIVRAAAAASAAHDLAGKHKVDHIADGLPGAGVGGIV